MSPRAGWVQGGVFCRSIVMLIGLLALLTHTAPSHAQGKPDVSASVSAKEVEVGEPLTVELRAWSQDSRLPSDPQLYVPAGLDVEGPRVATQFETRFGTGVNYVKQGIRATWQLVPQRPGSYVIPAPTVMVGGERVSAGTTMRVKVVPSTGRPRRHATNSPFGFLTPFGQRGLPSPHSIDFGSLLDDPDDDAPRGNDRGDKLAMDVEPEPFVFLRAVPDKRRAVVGEQITLSLYVYYRADFEMSDRHEPSLSDFLRVGLLASPGADAPTRTRVGSYRYLVRLLDRVALFPLRSGALHTGTMTAHFAGARVGRKAERASNDVVIDVREPPKQARPTDYRLGDVGTYRLSAEVKPREIEAGGSVAVQVRLQGLGNVPTSLEVPDRAGVEWSDPETREEVTTANDRVGGWRTFGYVVKIDEPGERYLGKIALPYYDPERKSYAETHVDLGNITVRPGSTPAPTAGPAGTGNKTEAEPAADPLGRLAPARLSLRPFEYHAARGIEPRTYWSLLLGPPLLIVLLGGLRRFAGRIAEKRAARRNDPAGLARRALREMSGAAELADKAAAAERALHLAIDAACGLKSRGLLLIELSAQLEGAGLPKALANDCAAELERCTAARFVPGSTDGTARELQTRVRVLVRRLLATARRGGRNASAGRPRPSTTATGASLLFVTGPAASLVLLASLLLPLPQAFAAPLDELFRTGTNALSEGDYDRAIQSLESLADQGLAHPDASYNRGLAYVQRVRAGAEKPGDLGRAAAAFEEALLLLDDYPDAELGLELVQAEVARRGARRGKDVVTERPSLDRLLVGLASERTWGIAAAVASLLLAVGLGLRAWRGRALRIASRVLAPVALLAMVMLTPLYLGARTLRLETRIAVVVVPELYLFDENGRSLGSSAVPEAAKVEVGERRGRMWHVRWGALEGWAALGSVRVIGGPQG